MWWLIVSIPDLCFFSYLIVANNYDLFRNHIRDNHLSDLCGVIEDGTHYYFNCIKYFDEKQVAS